MSTSGRQGYHHGDLRAELVRVAGEMLDQGGIAALTLREAARRAGVSHSAPYRHFADREALLAEVVGQGFAQLSAALRQAAPEGSHAVALAYLRYALARPRRYRLMFAGGASRTRRAGLTAQADSVLRVFVQSVPPLGDAERAGRAATAAWSLLHGLTLLLIDGYLGPVPEETDAERLVGEVLGLVRFAAKPADAT